MKKKKIDPCHGFIGHHYLPLLLRLSAVLLLLLFLLLLRSGGGGGAGRGGGGGSVGSRPILVSDLFSLFYSYYIPW